MSRIRYFVLPVEERGWTIRRDCRSLGAYGLEAQAMLAALEAAAIDRVRGHLVEVLRQEADGRWAPVSARQARRTGVFASRQLASPGDP
jgi:hypothetical protein